MSETTKTTDFPVAEHVVARALARRAEILLVQEQEARKAHYEFEEAVKKQLKAAVSEAASRILAAADRGDSTVTAFSCEPPVSEYDERSEVIDRLVKFLGTHGYKVRTNWTSVRTTEVEVVLINDITTLA